MKTDRILGIFFMAFAAAMVAACFEIHDIESARGISSRFWPLCILGAMFVLSSMLAWRGDGDYSLPWLKIACCLLFFVGYVFALRYCGYIIATFLFQFLFLLFLGIRGVKPVVIPIISTAVLTALFRLVLNVLLPMGVGIFRDLNIMILG